MTRTAAIDFAQPCIDDLRSGEKIPSPSTWEEFTLRTLVAGWSRVAHLVRLEVYEGNRVDSMGLLQALGMVPFRDAYQFSPQSRANG